MAGEINVSRYGNNEIIHGDDINYGETRAYENLTSILKNLAISVKDVIIQGGIAKERGTPDMNVDIEPILAFCVSTGKFVYYGTDFGPVAVTNGDGSQDRYDTLEVRLKETTFDEVQRAYKDPNTGDITYQNWKTKIHYELEAQVIAGTPGAGVAPNHTAGWIKIAEIFVETAESTSILNADIENADAGYDTEANSTWTAETDVTFRTGALTEVKEIFRVEHKESGTHEDDVIRDAHVDWGAGAGEVDGDLMPLGTTIVHAPTGGADANLTTVSTVRQAVQKILDLLIDLSGVQNDAVDSRHIAAGAIDSEHIANDQVDSEHYVADSIDDEHINWGIGANQISAADIPLADAGSRIAAAEVEAALQEIVGAGRTTETIKQNQDDIDAVETDLYNKHESDGDHKDNVIDDTHIDWGGGANQVNLDDMPDGSTYQRVHGDYVDGNGKIDSVKEVNGVRLIPEVISIGDWNMNSTSAVNVAHGLGASYKKIRIIDVIIRADLDNFNYSLNRTDQSGNTHGGISSINSTNVQLCRTSDQFFDNENFDSTSFNRGWITLWCEA